MKKNSHAFGDTKISKLTIKGFKSIKELNEFKPRDINILIGSNGAGKSNFIAFFRLLSWMVSSDGKLQEHIAFLGGANAILFDGAEMTKEMEGFLEIETNSGWNEFKFRLFFAAGDTLIFAEERARFSDKKYTTRNNKWLEFGAGQKEAKIINFENSDQTAGTITNILRKIIVYQFHNTAYSSRIRSKWSIDDNRWLKEDGANLASFLFRLKNTELEYYKKIVKHIRLVIPFFDDFVHENEYGRILLRWKEKNSDIIFNASQASDGMLRTIALITLLAQPEKDLPNVMFIDEPELGLHPYAIDVVSALLKTASRYSQIFVATQSAAFINNFSPEDIVVIDRKSRKSEFRRLNSEQLKQWLDEYTIAELWEKNILGGRP